MKSAALFLLLLPYLVYAQCPLTTPEFPFETQDDWWGDTYSWSAGLYLPTQIGGANTITTFGLRNNAGSGTYTDVRVYMRHTTTNNYNVEPGHPGTSGFTQVWNGTMVFSGGGVYTYTLATPFVFNGSDNLEVLVEHRGGENYYPWEPWFHRTNAAPAGVFPGKVGAGSSWNNAANNTSNRVFNLAIFINGVSAECTFNLPVELENAAIVCSNKRAELEWSTITETNNQFFEIEISQDGETWRKVGEVLGAGTTTEEQHYSFDLSQFVSGELSYVRLSQTDYDGTYEMLRVLSVNCSDFKKELVAYPNPFLDKLSINAAIEPNHIELVDLSGRSIELDYTYDLGKCQVNTQSIESGVYMLRLHFDDEITALKVVKL